MHYADTHTHTHHQGLSLLWHNQQSTIINSFGPFGQNLWLSWFKLALTVFAVVQCHCTVPGDLLLHPAGQRGWLNDHLQGSEQHQAVCQAYKRTLLCNTSLPPTGRTVEPSEVLHIYFIYLVTVIPEHVANQKHPNQEKMLLHIWYFMLPK